MIEIEHIQDIESVTILYGTINLRILDNLWKREPVRRNKNLSLDRRGSIPRLVAN